MFKHLSPARVIAITCLTRPYWVYSIIMVFSPSRVMVITCLTHHYSVYCIIIVVCHAMFLLNIDCIRHVVITVKHFIFCETK